MNLLEMCLEEEEYLKKKSQDQKIYIALAETSVTFYVRRNACAVRVTVFLTPQNVVQYRKFHVIYDNYVTGFGKIRHNAANSTFAHLQNP